MEILNTKKSPLKKKLMMKNKMKHVLLDIETMGNTSRSAITSIGAVQFDLNTGEIGEKVYTRVDLQSCLDVGLTMNADTVMWWMKQTDAARMEIAQKNAPLLSAALLQF